MTRWRKRLLLPPVIAIAGVGVYALGASAQRSGQPREERRQNSRTVPHERASLRSLETRLARLELETLASRHNGDEGRAPQSAESASAEMDGVAREKSLLPLAERRLKAAENSRQYFEDLHNSFDAEPRDAQWSGDVEERLWSAFENRELEDGSLVKAQCASTMCRLELSFESLQHYHRFDLAWQGMNPIGDGDATGTRQIGEDGKLSVILYLSRPEHRLPAIGRTAAH